ncbi:maleylpyruvate isomerase family mycothiol-dependent enzyme [Ornithinimicrobium pratense]|uniref:Maleylpyruvate isomerase family mycothiol-dependent enzyme n=1 Tax=Ornithinimicrobium pratense TaxID=2593973 RepID=A0A5J6V2R1_9MICO|nr:maleylpyruvate isomerase family mycothiol-dependent enzyme [Ornithinimicrobium pratense]QFG67441.1 maleylpyruvate isomerase family mycothiol-dependent enzyme [Ornithinimicrobium pratense]
MTQRTSTTTQDQHAPTFAGRAAGFTSILIAAGDAWDAPTPCAGWSVRDVVAHVIDTQRDSLADRGLDAGAVADLTLPAAAWEVHREHVVAVLGHDGVAEREYEGYFGPTTIGATMTDFYGWDLVVHGSDVARATGQQWSISDEEAQVLHAAADGWGEALYSEGICAAPVEVAPSASATDRLLARLGRDPHWQPT